jgi:hypothetical protein
MAIDTPDFKRLVVRDFTAYFSEKVKLSDEEAARHAEKLMTYVEEIVSAFAPEQNG